MKTSGRSFRLACWFAVLALAVSPVSGQEPFPAGVEGEIYYCPRIDLNPAKDGGPLTIDLDGLLDEEVWQRAAFHHYLEYWKPGGLAPTDLEKETCVWAAAADEQYLYLAWKSIDDTRHTEDTGCNAYRDDTLEVYLDANGDGIGCATCPYSVDDVQFLVGAVNIGKTEPAELEAGYVRSGTCITSGVITDQVTGDNLIRGVVQELVTDEDLQGWQGEIAIALTNLSWGQWEIDPQHGTTLGFDVHLDNDRNGGGQDAGADTAMIWSKRDPTSQAWQNTGVFGKLQFIAPSKPLATVARDLPDGLQNGGSGPVSLAVTPVFGVGTVIITEEIPPGLTGSNPSAPGVLAGSVITWNLGQVSAPVTVTYTLAASADAADVEFLGTATIDGTPMGIGGDRFYTGSPISARGFIKLWNHLGPLASGLLNGETCNTADLALDWIVNEDESITESDIFPFPGMVVRPKWGGDGQVPGTGARAKGVKTSDGRTVDQPVVWHAGLSSSDTVFHEAPAVHGYNADEQVTLSSIYVTNTGDALNTQIGADSDDAIQVYLGDQQLTPELLCRGLGAANTEASFFGVTLPEGESRILVKVADGGGNSGFRLRFQDPADPLLPGLLPPRLTVSLESAVTPPPVKVTRDLSRDTYGRGDTIDVSLALVAANPNTAVELTEVLPAFSTASSISDGGSQIGDTIEWSLSGVNTKTVTYRLTPAACAGSLAYGFSTWRVDAVEGVVAGESVATRDPVQDQPLGEWTSADLGAVDGAAERGGDHEVLVEAVGGGVKLSKDEFRFISLPQSGDFSLSARIDCLDDAAKVGQAGLMVRDTTDPHSATLLFFLSSTPPVGGGVGTLKGVFRRDTNPARLIAQVTIGQKDVISLPIYLKLARTGDKLSLQRSSDGNTYTEVATKDIGTANTQQIALGNDTLVGLAVAGGTAGTTRATFAEVSGPPFTSEALLPPTLTQAQGDLSSVTLTWTAPAGGLAPESYNIYRGPSGGPYAFVTGVPAANTSYLDGGLAEDTTYCYVVRSKRGATESGNSNENCATTLHGDPGGFRRGDADGNGTLELTDAIYVLNNQFLGGPNPGCMDAADADDSGAYDLTDAIFSLSFQFLGGLAPPAPGPSDCGLDFSQDPFVTCDYTCQ